MFEIIQSERSRNTYRHSMETNEVLARSTVKCWRVALEIASSAY